MTLVVRGGNDMGIYEVMLGLYRDNGQENENHYIIVGYLLG